MRMAYSTLAASRRRCRGSTSRWDTLPRLGAVERPRATLPHAFHQAGAEPRLPATDGGNARPRARRRARASGLSLPGVPLAASTWVRAVPLARGATRGLSDATRHTGPVGVMMGWTTFNMRGCNMRANRCRSRVALAPLHVEPCDGAMRRGEWCKTGGTHRVDGRRGWRGFWIQLAPKKPNVEPAVAPLRTYVSGLHADLWITLM